MYQMYISRGLRAGINQTLRDGRFAATRCRSLPLKSQERCLHATRRSFLNAAIKVQSSSPRPVCLVRYFYTSSARHGDGTLIYTGNITKAVFGVKLFSYSTSTVSALALPFVMEQMGIAVAGTPMQLATCALLAFYIFATPLCLHLVTKGYVVRLYHRRDTDTYTAVTYNALLREKKTVFHQSEVREPPVARMFTTFYGGKMGLMVNPESFPIPQDYNHLMGHDRPFTFDLEDLDKPDKS